MIQTFSDEEAEMLFQRGRSRKLPPSIQRRAYRKLLMLHAAISINDLRSPPSNHLEKLTGKRGGEYSIRINDQWRICFVWKSGHAYEVGIEDYH
ncbi:plasmid maintenance system killer [Candidatus Uhrbacteria bacterium CG10_big_fil_rev_8_21_14_0_10_48_16]|uniref:Plasmid maintenance system killer n=1 Tax=Candidatus Uhrbacteria bacterium CG10_big_fil_rev_8_21_14_0_10_48_16 TaxID=1975038 RepID=A0A2M8LG37_9BACT|nr:MAG: plasmid maintenance system killer [Candidatus Uhrbacteria bacterium CG10_big_fil_rev_8_21_14_0_10_48_16]